MQKKLIPMHTNFSNDRDGVAKADRINTNEANRGLQIPLQHCQLISAVYDDVRPMNQDENAKRRFALPKRWIFVLLTTSMVLLLSVLGYKI
jgi:hypothetical protein